MKCAIDLQSGKPDLYNKGKLPGIDVRQRLTASSGSTVSELVIPNPKASRTLEAGDRLLCFGKQEAMKSMVSQKTQKKREPKLQVLEQKMVEYTTAAPIYS